MPKVRIAIVGCGNCANSLAQGLQYYRGVNETDPVIGLVRPLLGGYSVKDIEIVSAFDVTTKKVGRPFHEAIWAFPNDTFRFAEVPDLGVTVQRGPTLDGRGKYLSEWSEESPEPAVDVALALKEAQVDVLINYLPVGSDQAAKYYAECALQAGCAMVNCIPVFLASDPAWNAKFEAAKLPIVGDDIKSQVGATIVHRVLTTLFRDRGVKLDRTLQLNIGGNGDFKNMIERSRLESKKISKTDAVVSVSGVDFAGRDIHIGPSDYVEWLGDRKWCYIKMEGRGFGNAPLHLELKLEVWDSPNSAGIVIDALRCAQLAKDRGIGGVVNAPSSYFMKHPPHQIDDSDALNALEEFLQ